MPSSARGPDLVRRGNVSPPASTSTRQDGAPSANLQQNNDTVHEIQERENLEGADVPFFEDLGGGERHVGYGASEHGEQARDTQQQMPVEDEEYNYNTIPDTIEDAEISSEEIEHAEPGVGRVAIDVNNHERNDGGPSTIGSEEQMSVDIDNEPLVDLGMHVEDDGGVDVADAYAHVGHGGHEEYDYGIGNADFFDSGDNNVDEETRGGEATINPASDMRDTHRDNTTSSRRVRHLLEHQTQTEGGRQGPAYEIRASDEFPRGDSSDFDYLDAYRHSCISHQPPNANANEEAPSPVEVKRLLAKLLRGDMEGTDRLFEQFYSLDLRDILLSDQPFEMDQLRPLPQKVADGTGPSTQGLNNGWHYVQNDRMPLLHDGIGSGRDVFAFSSHVKEHNMKCFSPQEDATYWQITCKDHTLGPISTMDNRYYDLPAWKMKFLHREDAIRGMLYHWAFSRALWQYLDATGYDMEQNSSPERRKFDIEYLRDIEHCNEEQLHVYQDYVLRIGSDLDTLNALCARDWKKCPGPHPSSVGLRFKQGDKDDLQFVQDCPKMTRWLQDMGGLYFKCKCHPGLEASHVTLPGHTVCIKSLITYWVKFPERAEILVPSLGGARDIVFHGVHMVRALLLTSTPL